MISTMPFRRSFRRRSMAPRPVTVSFKKVLDVAPQTLIPDTNIIELISIGKDSTTAGQTTPTDAEVPVGSIIKFIEIHWSVSQQSNNDAYAWYYIGQFRAGQVPINPRTVGGSDVRNQIFHQGLFMVGNDQNSNRTYRFKVPKRFQRVRAGDQWVFVHNHDTAVSSALQVIYKFYR